jgi:spore coat protein U-like protein
MDAAHAQVWGDPTPNYYRHVYWLFNPNPDVTLTVYGLIPALQDVAAGSYADNVIATDNFSSAASNFSASLPNTVEATQSGH